MYMYTGMIVPVQGRSPCRWVERYITGSMYHHHVTSRLLTRMSQHFLNGYVPCGPPPSSGCRGVLLSVCGQLHGRGVTVAGDCILDYLLVW
jgi:hypothetical protein